MVLEPSRTDGMVAVGVVEPQYKTNLAFRVLGRLTGRPVSVGDLVSEGQTVGVIDPTALELAVRSARAELTKAEAQLATATATEQRQRTLITTDATTKQTLDNAERHGTVAASVAHAQATVRPSSNRAMHRSRSISPASSPRWAQKSDRVSPGHRDSREA
jgi:multidrug efflux pump subunit AcrA (membrane-fusion protein)